MRGTWSICTLAVVLAACGDNKTFNSLPDLGSFAITTAEDTASTTELDLTDPDGNAVTLAVMAAPAHGDVAISGGSVTYTPAANYNGADQFVLTASDGLDSLAVTVDVTVTAVNDPPATAADSIAAAEDTASTVAQSALLSNDTDVDGDTLAIVAVMPGANGAVTIVGTDVKFTPNNNFVGIASFGYTVSDGTDTATGLVTVTVGGENDAPVAVDDARTTQEDTQLVIANLAANDTDTENNALSVTEVSGAVNGTVDVAAGTVTFTPDANFNGTASFNYTVSDGSATDTGVVTVTVTAVNDAPIAVDDDRTIAEDNQLIADDLAGNDTDVDTGTTLVVTEVSSFVNGTATVAGGTVTFTPDANFSGTASFDYTVSDGTDTDTGTVTITVTAVNDPPIAVDDAGATPEDTAITFTNLTTNDSDGGDGAALAVTAVSGATNGSVELNGGNPIFTPAPNFVGEATFTYTVSDGTDTDTGLVTITVTAVNDPPVAGDDTAAVQTNGSIDIPQATLLANDSDGGDGGALSIVLLQNDVNGSAQIVGNAVRFTPDADFAGAASFEYVVSDGVDTDVGLVTVTVSANPICGDGTIAAPETCDDGNTNSGDGCDGTTCIAEAGFDCTDEPSICTPICGDNQVVTGEACDDGNAIETDGCTSRCVVGVVCDVADFTGANRVVVDPNTGHCYVGFDGVEQKWQAAETSCESIGGHLPTVTSADENTTVRAAIAATDLPWLGGNDIATEGTFVWVTGETFGFTNFEPGQPDNDVGLGGNANCLHMFNLTSPSGSNLTWNDTNCDFEGFVTGRVCEIEVKACSDGVLQTSEGEECDDRNAANGDGCTSACQLENGCGNGTVDPGEECDDDNTVDGDTCSFPTCQLLDGCGDGNADTGEECDDNNITSGDGCSATCQFEGCGDGIVDPGEQCDDDNRTDGDGCSSTCTIEITLLGFAPATVSVLGAGGTAVVGIQIDNPAPAGGVIVNIASSSTDVAVPVSVTIPAGAKTVGIRIRGDAALTGSATVTATLSTGGSPVTATASVVAAGTAPALGELVINEVNYDVPQPPIDGDTNCNGINDASAAAPNNQGFDEFVELTNVSNHPLDLTGVSIWDVAAFSGTTPKFTFAAFTVGAGESVVVFGGQLGNTNTTSPWCTNLDGTHIGDAFAFAGPAGGLALNNGGDTVHLTATALKTSTELDVVTLPNGSDEAFERSPDFTGAFVKHSTIAGAAADRKWTPGTLVTGKPFAAANPL